MDKGSQIRRFDHLFVRGASADIPTEQKSAFGAEMGDIAALLRSCTSKSLVFVDELGRGTSPRDGTRLAGAILEAMAVSGMHGVFATHLHDILRLPLNSQERIVKKRMAIREDETLRWTYLIEDGVCTNSMALTTAQYFGLPDSIVQRAQELSAFIDANGSSTVSSCMDTTDAEDCIDTTEDCIQQHQPTVFERVVSEGEALTGQQSLVIPPFYNPPATLENTSAVYILELKGNEPRFYVGETDSVRERIGQHRTKWSSGFTAAVFPAPGGKSQAREWENRLIKLLSQKGYIMESIADGGRR